MSNQFMHDLCTIHGVEEPCIGVDFDGTIAQQIPYEGPGVFGKPVAAAAAAMTYLQSIGYKITIYTARGPASYEFMAKYCMDNNIPFDYINENPHTSHLNPDDCNPCKPNFDLIIDDKAIRFDGNWRVIVNNIKNLRYPYWMKGR